MDYDENAEADTVIEKEENPYLSDDAIAGDESVDLIDVRADRSDQDDIDVFTESMDVYGEDLDNFTEDLDEDIDSSLSANELFRFEEMAEEDDYEPFFRRKRFRRAGRSESELTEWEE